jgi:hypothetical protein
MPGIVDQHFDAAVETAERLVPDGAGRGRIHEIARDQLAFATARMAHDLVAA